VYNEAQSTISQLQDRKINNLTERLYYNDSTLLDFEAKVMASGQHKDLYYVVLDRTAFYPTSGGQSFDTGTLNGAVICDVIDSDDGDIRHLSKSEIAPVGQSVIGLIDKERRYRNCRNHTGQHIISAAAHRLFDLETMSVHLGDEYAAVEFDTNSLSPDEVQQLETAANDIIADNVEIEIIFAEASKIATLPLRKPPKRNGHLRIIRIGQFDYVACGGTHCTTSGGIGLVKIIGTEKIRGRLLVKYLAGKLAVEDYTQRFNTTDHLARMFTCHHSDLVAKIDKLSVEHRELRQSLIETQKQMLPPLVQSLTNKVIETDAGKIVVEPIDGLELPMVTRLATLTADETGGLVVLVTEGRLLLATASQSGIHAGKLAKNMAERCSLKGGGNEGTAQLGGADMDAVALYRDEIRKLLTNE